MNNTIYFVLWFFNRLQVRADNHRIPAQRQALFRWWQLVQKVLCTRTKSKNFSQIQFGFVKNTENVRDIFAILHDGTIVEWTGDKNLLTLKVGCQYLAEMIDPSFEYFFVDLISLSKLALVPWMNPADLEQEYFVEYADIFQAELDILSADIENDSVKVSCNQGDSSFDYCGGTLYIACAGIKIYDEQKSELTIDRLDQICKEYWDDFARR